MMDGQRHQKTVKNVCIMTLCRLHHSLNHNKKKKHFGRRHLPLATCAFDFFSPPFDHPARAQCIQLRYNECIKQVVVCALRTLATAQQHRAQAHFKSIHWIFPHVFLTIFLISIFSNLIAKMLTFGGGTHSGTHSQSNWSIVCSSN